jgi:hypothetical protein
MSGDDIQRSLGKLEAGIENLSEQIRLNRDERRTDIKQIFDRLDTISSSGCATGKRNAEAIKELQQRPERLVGIGAAIASILAAIGSALLWAMGKVH